MSKRQEKLNVLAKYLNVSLDEITQFDDTDCYFEFREKHEGWNIYTPEEREKYARIYLKEMIMDECYNHYTHLEQATGMKKEELMKLFKPANKEETCTLENVYDFLQDRELLNEYIEVIMADTSFDHYKEQLSPSLFEGEMVGEFYIYQWC